MISCQWELLAQPLPGAGDEQYVIGDPAFDGYVRLRYEDVADRLTGAGVDRILWMTCPYLSSTVGLDGLSPRFVDSRDPARVDRLNAIIDSDRRRPTPTSTCWRSATGSTQRIDDAAIRPDGSHFEYRGHNPAADAFVGRQRCTHDRRSHVSPADTHAQAAPGRGRRRGAAGRRSPRCRRTCARCAGSGRSEP